MRTTITLADDVAALLKRLRARRKCSMKELINQALREGLARLDGPEPEREPYHIRPIEVGRCRLHQLDDIAETLAVAEGETFR